MKYEVEIFRTVPVMSFGVPVEQHTEIRLRFESPADAAQWCESGNLMGLPGAKLRDGWLRCTIKMEMMENGRDVVIQYVDRLPVLKFDGDQPTVVE